MESNPDEFFEVVDPSADDAAAPAETSWQDFSPSDFLPQDSQNSRVPLAHEAPVSESPNAGNETTWQDWGDSLQPAVAEVEAEPAPAKRKPGRPKGTTGSKFLREQRHLGSICVETLDAGL